VHARHAEKCNLLFAHEGTLLYRGPLATAQSRSRLMALPAQEDEGLEHRVKSFFHVQGASMYWPLFLPEAFATVFSSCRLAVSEPSWEDIHIPLEKAHGASGGTT